MSNSTTNQNFGFVRAKYIVNRLTRYQGERVEFERFVHEVTPKWSEGAKRKLEKEKEQLKLK